MDVNYRFGSLKGLLMLVFYSKVPLFNKFFAIICYLLEI